MQIAIAIILTYLLIIVLHALYYQSEQYRLKFLQQKNFASCYLGKYRKELKNVQHLRDQEIGLRLEVESLLSRFPSPSVNEYRILPHKYNIVDIKGEYEIDAYHIRNMSFVEERDIIERTKLNIARQIGIKFLEDKVIDFSERMNTNNYNKIVTGTIKVAIEDK